jgi:hypothetical protein
MFSINGIVVVIIIISIRDKECALFLHEWRKIEAFMANIYGAGNFSCHVIFHFCLPSIVVKHTRNAQPNQSVPAWLPFFSCGALLSLLR